MGKTDTFACGDVSPRLAALCHYDEWRGARIDNPMTTNAERDRERIAELRRQARLAQGREPDAEASPAAPARRREPDAGPRFVEVGPGIQALTPEEAARRLKLSVREVLAKVDASQLVGRMQAIPLAEVERIEDDLATP